jgi:hypothetical protein
LDRAYVNFCHWGITQGGPDNVEFTERGFFVNWLRHKAYILKRVNFPRIDLVIPMAVLPEQQLGDELRPPDMSFIIISVKNKNSGDGISMPSIPREHIEGASGRKPRTEKSQEDVKKRKRKTHKGATTSKSEEQEEVAMSSNHNFCLHLNSLPFVKAVNDNGPQHRYPETNKSKPYIAIIMSLGDTDRQKNLFIGEDWKAKRDDKTHCLIEPATVTSFKLKFC